MTGTGPYSPGSTLEGSPSAFASASSYDDAHFCCCAGVAEDQARSDRCKASSLAVAPSGPTTKSLTVSIGWVTPPMCCNEIGPIFCAAPGVCVYGAPYVAVPLDPSSSVAAVWRKSPGADRLQVDRLICFLSGPSK